jgi:GNAT superfamily N-acetyltransferase
MTEQKISIRTAVPEDRTFLRELWHQVFQDSYLLIDTFLEDLPQTGFASVAEIAGRPVSMAFLLTGVSHRGISGAYLYAVATLPSYRDQGISCRIQTFCRSEAEKRGVRFLSTCPSEPSLYAWYNHTLALSPSCTFSSRMWTVPSLAAESTLYSRCGASAYGERREELLSAIPHASFALPFLTVQQHLSDVLGGGFYQSEFCAFAGYPEDGTLRIFEFLGDLTAGKSLLNAEASRKGCSKVQVRFPGTKNFCICSAPSNILKKGTWWGLLLD